MQKLKLFRVFGWTLLILVATILCIRQIGEPDVWWQIRTGQYIIETGSVPEVDVFSYTYDGTEWINVKWLTEVLMALVSNSLGPEFLMLLQWLALLLMLYLLYRIILELHIALRGKAGSFSPAVMLVLLLFMAGMAYRLNARPEMVSHVFTAVFLYLFIRHHNRVDYRIFLLIPLQMLWANMHEAYGVGIVMMLIFLFGRWLQFYFYEGPGKALRKKENLKLTGVVIVAILVCGIHPSGIRMIWHPLEIFGQLGDNKFTTELFSYKQDGYWQFPSYLMILIALMVAGVGLLHRKKYAWNKLPLAYPLLFAAFLYLSLQAYRNIPFFLLVAIPPLAVTASTLFADKIYSRIIAITAAVAFYIWVGSGNFYERFIPREKYGLRIDPSRSVIGPARYIKQHNISGNGFVDYISSSYFLWYMAPDFKSYIDLRDLDIYEELFIKNILMAYARPQTPTKMGGNLWEVMEREDDFSYVVLLNREAFMPLHHHLINLPDWTMAYSDLNATVYLKNVEANQHLIEQAKNRSFTEHFHPYGELPTPQSALMISKIFWPPYQEVNYQKLDYSQRKAYLQQLLGLEGS